eukprot:1156772-Pelagomonas_calceolata.AAC.19
MQASKQDSRAQCHQAHEGHHPPARAMATASTRLRSCSRWEARLLSQMRPAKVFAVCIAANAGKPVLAQLA